MGLIQCREKMFYETVFCISCGPLQEWMEKLYTKSISITLNLGMLETTPVRLKTTITQEDETSQSMCLV